MEAGFRLRFFSIGLIAVLLAGSFSQPAVAADARSQNFIVFAPDQQLANAVAQSAERYRRELATYWLGKELPPWPAPCPIRVIAGPRLAAQGVTTYNRAPVRDFQMEVVGTPERILDSVLPHEVNHTVMATYFGRPLPRWADEGICTTVEHVSERSKHEAKLREFLRTRRGIAMNQLFLLTEYPPDMLPMYAQGYSVCRFLIAQKGPRAFIQFLQDYMKRPSWTENVRKHYEYDSLKELQDYWLAWVDAGSADVAQFAKVTLPGRTSPVATPTSSAALALADARGNTLPARPRGEPLVRQASAATPIPRADPEPGTALASAVADGWYQRRRAKAPGQSAGVTAAESVRPMVPPSIRTSGRYQSAQPQAEQRISR